MDKLQKQNGFNTVKFKKRKKEKPAYFLFHIFFSSVCTCWGEAGDWGGRHPSYQSRLKKKGPGESTSGKNSIFNNLVRKMELSYRAYKYLFIL